MAEISREFAEVHGKQSANWLKQHDNSLLVRDSFKHKDKVNGYVADHFKIAMEGKKEKPLKFKLNLNMLKQMQIWQTSFTCCKNR